MKRLMYLKLLSVHLRNLYLLPKRLQTFWQSKRVRFLNFWAAIFGGSYARFRKCLLRKVDGFSLIEISIVLVIVGVMFGAIFKGRDLLEQVKEKSTADDFTNIQTIIMLYANDYDAAILSDPSSVWKKLAQAELLTSEAAPTSKLGGVFSIIKSEDNYVLKLGKGENSEGAFLTRAQVTGIVARLQSAKNVVVRKKDKTVVPSIHEENSNDELYTVEVILN